jgi:hypothetical protein
MQEEGRGVINEFKLIMNNTGSMSQTTDGGCGISNSLSNNVSVRTLNLKKEIVTLD